MKLSIHSNYVFLIPAALSLYYGFYWHFLAILFMVASSLLYHINEEKKYRLLDNIFAYLLIIANLYLVYLSKFNLVYSLLAIFFVGVAFFFFFRAQKANYEFNHAMWHFSSVFITIFCILAYGTL